MTLLAPTLEAFFSERLIGQLNVSPHTVTAYRDTFRLLLAFVQDQTGTAPSSLQFETVDAKLVGSFLNYLEVDRNNSARTRNARLAAIHSLFRFAALRHPEHAAHIQRVLAIESKRFDRALVSFLSDEEVRALLGAPDQTTTLGRRDYALLLLALQTGLRVSELVGLCGKDVVLDATPHVRCTGKGRKERVTPLSKLTASALKSWTRENSSRLDAPFFSGPRGAFLSRHAISAIVARHAASAAQRCPTLKSKVVTPHTLRHTTAMRLLQTGTDSATIALWLGHESVRTTGIYIHADMAIKERALVLTTPIGTAQGRYRPTDALLAFLEAL